MTLTRNKLYTTLFVACLAGYIWLYFSITSPVSGNPSVEVCLLKHTTNIPCPSCGSTRSVISLLRGNFLDALKINPLGYIIAIIMLSAPFWITIDVATKRKTLFEFYRKFETFLKRRQYAIPLIVLLVGNWIWNIVKGL